jgi:hypothetical protein
MDKDLEIPEGLEILDMICGIITFLKALDTNE